MKDITLKIIGKQSYDDMEEEQMEFVTDGRLYVRGGSAYIIYDESEVSGRLQDYYQSRRPFCEDEEDRRGRVWHRALF